MTLGSIETPWLRRALFVAVNVAAALVLVTGVLLPVHDLFAEREARIEELRGLLARLEMVAAQGAHVRALAQERGAERTRGEFLTGPNDGVITAELQTRLKGMVQGVGAQVRSVQTIPARTDSGLKYVGSRIEIHGPIQAVQRAIHAVETAKPYLFVSSASLRLVPSVVGRTGGTEEPILQAQLDLVGAVLPEERE